MPNQTVHLTPRTSVALAGRFVDGVGDFLVESEYHVGKLQTFNWPVLSRARVDGDTFAIDMESFAITQTAAKYHIPAIIIKAVSDIVPKHVSLISLLELVRRFKTNSKGARAHLSMNVIKIIEDEDLIG